jgi:hypothetical protein
MTQIQNPPSHKTTAGRQIRKLTPPEAETDAPLSRVDPSTLLGTSTIASACAFGRKSGDFLMCEFT